MEENSDLVRQIVDINEHAAAYQEGAFYGFEDYLTLKISRLQEQWNTPFLAKELLRANSGGTIPASSTRSALEAPSGTASGSTDHSDADTQNVCQSAGQLASSGKIFEGIIAWINGLTVPTNAELRVMLVSHGAKVVIGYASGVTHIIASSFPITKLRELSRLRNPPKVVTGQWVVDCVRKGKRLPEYDYGLAILQDVGHVNRDMATILQHYRRTTQPQPQQQEQTRIQQLGTQILGGATITSPPSTAPTAESGFSTSASPSSLSSAPTESESKDNIARVRSSSIPSATLPPLSALVAALDEEGALLRPATRASLVQAIEADGRKLLRYLSSSRLHLMGSWKHKVCELQLWPALRHFVHSSLAQANTASPDFSKVSILPVIASPISRKGYLKHPLTHRHRTVYLHVDLDCFFVSVALIHNPNVDPSRPVAVSHGTSATLLPPSEAEDSVTAANRAAAAAASISSCNYAARALGIRADMSVKRALMLAPDLVVLPYDFPRILQASSAAFCAMASLCAGITPVSLDEGYIDIDIDSLLRVYRSLKQAQHVSEGEVVLGARSAARRESMETPQYWPAQAQSAVVKFLGTLDPYSGTRKHMLPHMCTSTWEDQKTGLGTMPGSGRLVETHTPEASATRPDTQTEESLISEALAWLCTEIRNRIRLATGGCEASIGVGPSRALARMATQHAKPAGVFRVTEESKVEFIANQRLDALPGVGRRRANNLAKAIGRAVDYCRDLYPSEDGTQSKQQTIFASHRRATEAVVLKTLGQSLGGKVIQWIKQGCLNEDEESVILRAQYNAAKQFLLPSYQPPDEQALVSAKRPCLGSTTEDPGQTREHALPSLESLDESVALAPAEVDEFSSTLQQEVSDDEGDEQVETGRKIVSVEMSWGVRPDSIQRVIALIGAISAEVVRRLRSARVASRAITLKLYVRDPNSTSPSWFMGHGVCDVFTKTAEITPSSSGADHGAPYCPPQNQNSIDPGPPPPRVRDRNHGDFSIPRSLFPTLVSTTNYDQQDTTEEEPDQPELDPGFMSAWYTLARVVLTLFRHPDLNCEPKDVRGIGISCSKLSRSLLWTKSSAADAQTPNSSSDQNRAMEQSSPMASNNAPKHTGAEVTIHNSPNQPVRFLTALDPIPLAKSIRDKTPTLTSSKANRLASKVVAVSPPTKSVSARQSPASSPNSKESPTSSGGRRKQGALANFLVPSPSPTPDVSLFNRDSPFSGDGSAPNAGVHLNSRSKPKSSTTLTKKLTGKPSEPNLSYLRTVVSVSPWEGPKISPELKTSGTARTPLSAQVLADSLLKRNSREAIYIKINEDKPIELDATQEPSSRFDEPSVTTDPQSGLVADHTVHMVDESPVRRVSEAITLRSEVETEPAVLTVDGDDAMMSLTASQSMRMKGFPVQKHRTNDLAETGVPDHEGVSDQSVPITWHYSPFLEDEDEIEKLDTISSNESDGNEEDGVEFVSACIRQHSTLPPPSQRDTQAGPNDALRAGASTDPDDIVIILNTDHLSQQAFAGSMPLRSLVNFRNGNAPVKAESQQGSEDIEADIFAIIDDQPSIKQTSSECSTAEKDSDSHVEPSWIQILIEEDIPPFGYEPSFDKKFGVPILFPSDSSQTTLAAELFPILAGAFDVQVQESSRTVPRRLAADDPKYVEGSAALDLVLASVQAAWCQSSKADVPLEQDAGFWHNALYPRDAPLRRLLGLLLTLLIARGSPRAAFYVVSTLQNSHLKSPALSLLRQDLETLLQVLYWMYGGVEI